MKKIYITLLFLAVIQLCSFAHENYRGEEIIKQIDDAAIKANPKKMEKLWNEFCLQNPDYCEVIQPKYNELLYNAKLRQQKKRRQIWMGIAAGLAGSVAAAGSTTTQQLPYYINQQGQMIGPGIYNPPSYNIYNTYGQNIGRITPY